jgi:hypothetical protein
MLELKFNHGCLVAGLRNRRNIADVHKSTTILIRKPSKHQHEGALGEEILCEIWIFTNELPWKYYIDTGPGFSTKCV